MPAGAPVGNKNASKARPWVAAINRALANRSKLAQTEALDALAERLLRACDEGDMVALKELGDRLDGKPVQGIDGTVTLAHAFAVPLPQSDDRSADDWARETAP